MQSLHSLWLNCRLLFLNKLGLIFLSEPFLFRWFYFNGLAETGLQFLGLYF